MNNNIVTVTSVTYEYITFSDGSQLYSYHDQDCCENHYLDFEHLNMVDFEGLSFELSGDTFFKRIEGYGIELVPVNGHSVRIAGYSYNNGYYSDKLTLILKINGTYKAYDITECQEVSG